MSVLIERIRRAIRLFRLTPFDTSCDAGRSNERYRRMMLTTMAAALARLAAMATVLVSVPLALHYLGDERYGLWLTISSLVTILAFADLGIGNGLLTRVAVAHGKNDRAAIQRYVTSGFYVLAAIAGLIILGFVCIYPWVSWARVFNLRSDLARIEVGPSVAVFVVCFALSIPASIVQKVQAGLQEGFVANLWQCLGSVVSLVGVVLTVHFRLGLPWLVLSIMAGPLLVSGLNGILFFGRKERQLAPRPAAFSFVIAAQTAQTGVMFLILQVVGAAAYSSDSLVISRVLGPAVVPQYAVPEKLFAVIAQVVGTALMPLWPAYGEAISRADGPWVRRTFRYSVSMAMGLAGSASAVVALATPLLLHWWVGDSIHPSWALVAGLAVWKTIEAGGNSVAMFLNGAQIIRFQILTATAGGIAILTLKIGLVSRFGVAGAVWATIVGYSLCVGLPAAFRIKQLLRALTHSHSGELPLNQG